MLLLLLFLVMGLRGVREPIKHGALTPHLMGSPHNVELRQYCISRRTHQSNAMTRPIGPSVVPNLLLQPDKEVTEYDDIIWYGLLVM